MGKGTVISRMRIFLTVLGLITELLAFAFSFLSNAPSSLGADGNTTTVTATGLFIQTIESLRIKYPNSWSPAAWVFAVIWPLIFLWNTIAVFYMIASLCLPAARSPILRDPPLIPMGSLIAWNVCWSTLIAWLFLYDREYFGAALFFLIVGAISSYAFLGFSYHSISADLQVLEGFSTKMLWLVRILIHNGFAILATWLTCAWKLNFATVITYVDSRGIDKIPADLIRSSFTTEDARTTIMSLLIFELILWFVLENFVFEKHCRYTLTIYPVLIFALTGIFTRYYVYPFTRNQAITLAALVMACVAFAFRVPYVIYKHRNSFLYA